MTTASNRRTVVRALLVFVLAAIAITAFSAMSAQASDTTTTSAIGTSASDSESDSLAVEAGAPPDEAADPGGTDTLPPELADAPAANRLLQSMVNGVVFGLLLALASVGLSLIYGTTGLSNFAHGEQVTFGAIMTYFFTTQQPVSLPLVPTDFVIGWPLIPSALMAIAIAGSFGWLQDRFLWGQLRRRGVGLVQQMIVSIGLSLAILNFIQWWMGGRRLRLTPDIDPRYQIGPIYLGEQTVMSMLIALVCLGGVGYFLLKTRRGRATRAVSDNRALAAASGIKVDSIIRLVWVLAAALAAIGGILLALYENGTAFDAGARLLLLMFAAVTLGGLGHPFGALVGSLIIGIVAEVSTVWLAPDLKIAVALGILIVVLLVRPQGILGRAERVG